MKTRILPPMHRILGIIVLAGLMLVFNFSASANGGKGKKPLPPLNLVLNSGNSPVSFTTMDGNAAYDDDGLVNGVVHVASLTIQSTGSITNPGGVSGINLSVTGNVQMDAGSSINGDGSGGGGVAGTNITITAGGNITLAGGAPGASITSFGQVFGCGDGGNITLTAGGDINTFDGSQIYTKGCSGGAIVIIANGPTSKIDIDGLVESEGTIAGVPNQPPGGGPITIIAKCNLTISDTGDVISKGKDPGADLVHLEACEVDIYGLVQSTGAGHVIPVNPKNHLNSTNRPDKPCNSTAGVEVWANTILIDGLDHNGEVAADLGNGGGATGTSWIDLFARNDITIKGTTAPYNGSISAPAVNSNFAVHANGNSGNTDDGGMVTIKSTEGSVIANGLAVQADGPNNGGLVTIQAKNQVDLTGASLYARGDIVFAGGNGAGGNINIRSFQSSISWTDGVGDVRPTGDAIPVKGLITFKKCTTLNVVGTTFPDNGPPATSPQTLADACVGNPLLPCEEPAPVYPGCPVVACNPYVVLPAATCTQACQPCHGKITINKHVINDCPDLHGGTFHFSVTKDAVAFTTFDITASFGADVAHELGNLDPGTYVVTEQLDPLWVSSTPACADAVAHTFNTLTFTIVACESLSCTFNNRNLGCDKTGCQWCNKGAVLSQVWQNPGCNINDQEHKCIVPDILVDVTMAHGGANDVVTSVAPNEIRSNTPATWSIQAAVDFATNPANAALFTGCEIFIGVVSTQTIGVDPLDPTSCGYSCAHPLGGDAPWGIENVVVTNNTGKRLNIFGCSVTMKPLDATKPFMKIIGSGSKVTVMDIHVKNSRVGYYVYNNGGKITIKNSRAMYCDTGYWVKDNDVEITGSQEISHGKIGILLDNASLVSLRTNNSIMDNNIAGIKLLGGNTNDLNGNDCGLVGHPNAIGILGVSTNSNSIHDGTAYGNSGDAINLTGNSNNIKQNKIGDKNKGNGGDGIHFSGAGNTLDGNDVFGNTGDGIDGAGGTAASPNVIVKNNCGDKDKGNGGNGILLAGVGNGAVNPVEVDGNTTRTNGNDGIKITGTGMQLKNNTSGGGSDQNNFHCEYEVGANINSGSNKANNVTVVGAFSACTGSPTNNMVTLPDNPAAPTQIALELFPNPTKGRTTVEFYSVYSGKYSMNVIDIAGRTIRNESVQAVTGINVYELDLSKMAKGVYMVSMQNGTEKIMKKVVIE